LYQHAHVPKRKQEKATKAPQEGESADREESADQEEAASQEAVADKADDDKAHGQ